MLTYVEEKELYEVTLRVNGGDRQECKGKIRREFARGMSSWDVVVEAGEWLAEVSHADTLWVEGRLGRESMRGGKCFLAEIERGEDAPVSGSPQYRARLIGMGPLYVKVESETYYTLESFSTASMMTSLPAEHLKTSYDD